MAEHDNAQSSPLTTAAYSGGLRPPKERCVRPMQTADCEAAARLATELGYPNDAASIRARIEAIGASDLLLVATDAEDRAIGFIQAHLVCPIEVGHRVEILAWSSRLTRGEAESVDSSSRKWSAGLRRWARKQCWCEATPHDTRATPSIQPWVTSLSKPKPFTKSDCDLGECLRGLEF